MKQITKPILGSLCLEPKNGKTKWIKHNIICDQRDVLLSNILEPVYSVLLTGNYFLGTEQSGTIFFENWTPDQ